MSKQDTCIFYEYFGDYGMSLCNHPIRANNKTIYDDCRTCKLYQTSTKGILRCPFCGGKARLNRFSGEFHIACPKCGVEMTDSKIDVVMNKWNKRVEGK